MEILGTGLLFVEDPVVINPKMIAVRLTKSKFSFHTFDSPMISNGFSKHPFISIYHLSQFQSPKEHSKAIFKSMSHLQTLLPQTAPLQVDGTYGSYDLACVPRSAWPDKKKIHLGAHSYTVNRGQAKFEVLLRNKAYFVRSPGEKKQFTWSKHGGPQSAWIAACSYAGVLP